MVVGPVSARTVTPFASACSRGRSSASRAASPSSSTAAPPMSTRPSGSTSRTASARPRPTIAVATTSPTRGDHCPAPACQDPPKPARPAPTIAAPGTVAERGVGPLRDAVICAAVRTPVGKRGGGLSGVHAVDLSAVALTALVERTGLDPAVIDDVFWGCVSQVGEQTYNVGRLAALAAGWPESVPGTTIDRQCGSSQQAVAFAAATVVSGQADVVVAGGVESMSRVPMGSSAGDG